MSESGSCRRRRSWPCAVDIVGIQCSIGLYVAYSAEETNFPMHSNRQELTVSLFGQLRKKTSNEPKPGPKLL